MRGKRVSDEFVKAIYRRRDAGIPIRQIASETGSNESTIRGILKRRLANTKFQRKSRLGRPRTTSTRTDQRISMAMKRDRFQTYRAIAKDFQISEQTVRRRSLEKYMKKRVALVNVLNRAQQQNRVRWCANHKNTDFGKWIFSDEATFHLADCSGPRRVLCHRKNGEKYNPNCVVFNPVKSRQSVSIWGWFNNDGSGCFQLIKGTINSTKYINILTEKLLPYLDNIPINSSKDLVFQQDNAPPHTSAATHVTPTLTKSLIRSMPRRLLDVCHRRGLR